MSKVVNESDLNDRKCAAPPRSVAVAARSSLWARVLFAEMIG
jgi:hypothetical protein